MHLYAISAKKREIVITRVYEASDIDRAIELMADGKIDIVPFINSVNTLPNCCGDNIGLRRE